MILKYIHDVQGFNGQTKKPSPGWKRALLSRYGCLSTSSSGIRLLSNRDRLLAANKGEEHNNNNEDEEANAEQHSIRG